MMNGSFNNSRDSDLALETGDFRWHAPNQPELQLISVQDRGEAGTRAGKSDAKRKRTGSKITLDEEISILRRLIIQEFPELNYKI